MRVTVIGAEGFVGSAFVAYLRGQPHLEVMAITRSNYAQMAGQASDVVIEAACNSRKYLADDRPVEEFDQAVTHRLRTLHDFPAGLSLHLSSVDVYSDLSSPVTTREDSLADLARVSHYGFHKRLAEQLVQHYAHRWLVVRLAGMVGPGLRKNPIHDIVHGEPLRIHPDSQYQFMATTDVARIVWALVESGISGEVFNICGQGLISPREVAALAGRPLDLSKVPPAAAPPVVHINTEKISRRTPMPCTRRSVALHLQSCGCPGLETVN
jgi:nucleoside-diphosphate-sugar epimerase